MQHHVGHDFGDQQAGEVRLLKVHSPAEERLVGQSPGFRHADGLSRKLTLPRGQVGFGGPDDDHSHVDVATEDLAGWLESALVKMKA